MVLEDQDLKTELTTETNGLISPECTTNLRAFGAERTRVYVPRLTLLKIRCMFAKYSTRNTDDNECTAR